MGRVTFDEAVRRALARNPTALEAQEEVHRFHALMEAVRASSLPVLNAYATYTRIDHDRVSNGVVFTPVGSLNVSAVLNAPLIYPRGWLTWSEASDQVDVARANEADVRRTVAVATARGYLTIITQKRLLDVAGTARDNAKAHYEFTRAQRIGGVGNRLDEVRAAQEFTTDEVNVQSQAVALSRAREALGVFVATEGPVDVANEDTPDKMPTLNDAMTDAEKVRPDERARDVAAEPADRTVRHAWADYVPYLNLIATPFFQDPRDEYGSKHRVAGPARAHRAHLRWRLALREGARAQGARERGPLERRGDASSGAERRARRVRRDPAGRRGARSGGAIGGVREASARPREHRLPRGRDDEPRGHRRRALGARRREPIRHRRGRRPPGAPRSPRRQRPLFLVADRRGALAVLAGRKSGSARRPPIQSRST